MGETVTIGRASSGERPLSRSIRRRMAEQIRPMTIAGTLSVCQWREDLQQWVPLHGDAGSETEGSGLERASGRTRVTFAGDEGELADLIPAVERPGIGLRSRSA